MRAANAALDSFAHPPGGWTEPAVARWRSLLVAIAATALLFVSARAADGDDEDNSDGPARFHAVKAWRGTLVARARVNPAALALVENMMVGRGKGAEMTYDFSAYQVIEFELTEYESDPSVWTGQVTKSYYSEDGRYFLHMPDNYANNRTTWKGYSDHEHSYSMAGPLDFGDDPVATLKFHRERGWSVHFATGRGKATQHKRWYQYIPPESEQDPAADLIIGESSTVEEDIEITVVGMNGTNNHPYPEKGLVLVGSDPDLEGGSTGAIAANVLWDYTVSLEPTALEELRLVIEVPTKYDEWRPKTTPDAAAGPALDVTVRVETAQGGKPKGRVEKFVWELTGTSKEPGVAMNYPLNAKDHRFDLDLGAEGEFFVLRDENQKLERTVREGFTDKAKVVPYDWGGWSTLQVKAHMADGRVVVGKLKDQNEAGLRVPKRAAKSYIADAWKKETGASGADTLDDEKVEGQKLNGDGFTLYEEYRGWIEDGGYINGDPKGKDFFVLNLIGGDAQAGIDLFEGLSELRVHSKLQPTEMSQTTRLMNGNRRAGPHNKAQHGVWVKTFSRAALGDDGADTPMSKAGVAGRPGLAKGVGILARSDPVSAFNKPFNLPAQDAIFAYDRAIAHELLHSVGVEHHGPPDKTGYALTFVPPNVPKNKIGRPHYQTGDGTPFTLLMENGHDLAASVYVNYARTVANAIGSGLLDLMISLWSKGPAGSSDPAEARRNAEESVRGAFDQAYEQKGMLGREHAEHSGNQDCVMRYYFARFYEAKGRENALYIVAPGTERIGLEICRSGKGTGNNASKPPNLQQSRFGDAAPGEGDCFSQICPNDAIPPRSVK